MKTYALIPALAFSTALVFGGCLQNDDDLTQEDYDDIATAVGSLVANSSGGELGSIQGQHRPQPGCSQR